MASPIGVPVCAPVTANSPVIDEVGGDGGRMSGGNVDGGVGGGVVVVVVGGGAAASTVTCTNADEQNVIRSGEHEEYVNTSSPTNPALDV